MLFCLQGKGAIPASTTWPLFCYLPMGQNSPLWYASCFALKINCQWLKITWYVGSLRYLFHSSSSHCAAQNGVSINLQPTGLPSVGSELAQQPFRWDQRVFATVLRWHLCLSPILQYYLLHVFPYLSSWSTLNFLFAILRRVIIW